MCECPGCYYASEGFGYNIKESCLQSYAGEHALQHSDIGDSSLPAGEEVAAWHEVVPFLVSPLGEHTEAGFQEVLTEQEAIMEDSDKMEN